MYRKNEMIYNGFLSKAGANQPKKDGITNNELEGIIIGDSQNCLMS
jgi:hypothetical protein